MASEGEVREQIIPYLCVSDAAAAAKYYETAFAAREIFRMPMPNGKIGHLELRIGDAAIYLSDEAPEHGVLGPKSIGGSPVTIHLHVPDVDTVFARAVEAGATALMPPADMFWGDRFGKLVDPFGHVWSIATTKEKLTPEQMQVRMAAAMTAKVNR